MPLSTTLKKIKTKAEIDAEVPADGIRLDKDTKVVALELGYSEILREAGDVFFVKKGTIYRPGITWFEPVADNTVTTEEADAYDDMTVSELKIALAKEGVDFAGVNKKADLVELLVNSRAESDLA